MKLAEARTIAERVRSDLAPWCDRIEIAGSIRRRKPEVGDIEIVCIPKVVDAGFLGDTVRHPGFVTYLARLPRLKGDPAVNKYTQILLPEGVNLDLFTAKPDNWGLIFAIRTGSADYSHRVLARGWVRRGYKSADGMLHDAETEEAVPVREEADLYRIIGIPWCEPKDREV